MKILFTLASLSLCLSSCDDQKPAGETNGSATPESKSSDVTDSTERKISPKAKVADIVSARTAMDTLVVGVENYYDEYSQLPLALTESTDGEKSSDNELMSRLVGLESAKEENFKQMSFVDFPQAKEMRGGLLREENKAILFDPWGNHYQLVLNYDYDDELREPAAIGDEIHYNTKVLVWCHGPDGKSGTPETNQDNIYSWAKSK